MVHVIDTKRQHQQIVYTPNKVEVSVLLWFKQEDLSKVPLVLSTTFLILLNIPQVGGERNRGGHPTSVR